MAWQKGAVLSLLLGASLAVLSGNWQGAAADTPYDAGVAAYSRGDYAAARQAWEKALAGGDWEAARNLGLLYRKGLGVPADQLRALGYYREAAAHGVINARLNLAELYLSGQGVPRDEAKAKALLQAAADAGNMAARYRLDEILDAEARGGQGLALTAPSAGPRLMAAATQAAVPTASPSPSPLPTSSSTPTAVPPPDQVTPPPHHRAPPPVAKAAVSPPPRPTPAPPVPGRKPPPPRLNKAVVTVVRQVAAAEAPPPLPLAEIDAMPVRLPPLRTPGQIRVHVASFRDESAAAQGWLRYNLPGLSPDLDAVVVPGQGRFVRLYAVGPRDLVLELCADAQTRGAWCAAAQAKK